MPESVRNKQKPATVRVSCHAATSRNTKVQTRQVIEEQPVRIMVNGTPLATLMRTPGNEVELAIGFLLTEGIVHSRKEISAVSFCKDGSLGTPGEILVRLAGGAAAPRQGYRDVMSSCSLCGGVWIEELIKGITPFPQRSRKITAEDVFRLAAVMPPAQNLFELTGAAHCAAVAELPVQPFKKPPVVREDIGRHNALDKAVGAAGQCEMDLDRSLLLLSSRLSFEMAAKAARAGISCVAGVSAPSAAAIRLAKKLNMFLAGFVRGQTMTVYAGLRLLKK